MPDWSSVFVPDASLLESFVRGSVVYLSILILFRVVMKRQSGSLGLPDVMLVVLVSECVSTALSSEAKSVANGIVAVGALLFWSFVLDRLGHRWPWFQRLLEPQPVVLVEDGKPNHENLDREGITDEELARAGSRARNRRPEPRQVGDPGVRGNRQRDSESRRIQNESSMSPSRLDRQTDLEGSVKRFLTVADELRAAIEWHERCAADHRAAAKMTRALLIRHGLRKPPPKSRPGQDEKGS